MGIFDRAKNKKKIFGSTVETREEKKAEAIVKKENKKEKKAIKEDKKLQKKGKKKIPGEVDSLFNEYKKFETSEVNKMMRLLDENLKYSKKKLIYLETFIDALINYCNSKTRNEVFKRIAKKWAELVMASKRDDLSPERKEVLEHNITYYRKKGNIVSYKNQIAITRENMNKQLVAVRLAAKGIKRRFGSTIKADDIVKELLRHATLAVRRGYIKKVDFNLFRNLDSEIGNRINQYNEQESAWSARGEKDW